MGDFWAILGSVINSVVPICTLDAGTTNCFCFAPMIPYRESQPQPGDADDYGLPSPLSLARIPVLAENYRSQPFARRATKSVSSRRNAASCRSGLKSDMWLTIRIIAESGSNFFSLRRRRRFQLTGGRKVGEMDESGRFVLIACPDRVTGNAYSRQPDCSITARISCSKAVNAESPRSGLKSLIRSASRCFASPGLKRWRR
jgi:hypothetical protein